MSKVELKQHWVDANDRSARVMAVAEGYVMMRRHGCAPFVISRRALLEGWRIVEKKREIIDRLIRRFG